MARGVAAGPFVNRPAKSTLIKMTVREKSRRKGGGGEESIVH